MISRTYAASDGGTVRFSLSAPIPASHLPTSEWQVTITSHGLRPEIHQPIYGVDGMQAMELAIAMVRTIEQSNGLELTGP